MPDITIGEFANDVGVSVERIQEQLVEAGLPTKNAKDVITDVEKSELSTRSSIAAAALQLRIKSSLTLDFSITPPAARTKASPAATSHNLILSSQ